MLFIVRSTICLGFVFWSIPPQDGGGTARDIAKAPAAGIARAVDGYCNSNPAACLKIASRLSGAGKDISLKTVFTAASAISGQDKDDKSYQGTSQSTLTAADLSIAPRNRIPSAR